MKRAIQASLAAAVFVLVLAASALAEEPVQVGQFGAAGAEAGQLSKPSGVAIDQASGDVYVADTGNHRVQRFDAQGAFLSAFGWGVDDGTAALQTCTSGCEAGIAGTGDGQLSSPAGIAVDPTSGDVYVANRENGIIERFETSGAYVSSFGGYEEGNPEKFSYPLSFGNDIAVDSTGRIFVSNGYATPARVAVFSAAGAFESSITGSGANALINGSSLAIDSADNLYVLDPFRSEVEVFDASGAFVRREAKEVGAAGIAVNPANGHLFVEGTRSAPRSATALVARAAASPTSSPPPSSGPVPPGRSQPLPLERRDRNRLRRHALPGRLARRSPGLNRRRRRRTVPAAHRLHLEGRSRRPSRGRRDPADLPLLRGRRARLRLLRRRRERRRGDIAERNFSIASGGVHPVSADGSKVFFETPDSLVPADSNGLIDTYEWSGGAPHLISSGAGDSNSIFVDASPSGNDVYFSTRDRLLRLDRDENSDVYDARVGGGFPLPAPEPALRRRILPAALAGAAGARRSSARRASTAAERQAPQAGAQAPKQKKHAPPALQGEEAEVAKPTHSSKHGCRKGGPAMNGDPASSSAALLGACLLLAVLASGALAAPFGVTGFDGVDDPRPGRRPGHPGGIPPLRGGGDDRLRPKKKGRAPGSSCRPRTSRTSTSNCRPAWSATPRRRRAARSQSLPGTTQNCPEDTQVGTVTIDANGPSTASPSGTWCPPRAKPALFGFVALAGPGHRSTSTVRPAEAGGERRATASTSTSSNLSQALPLVANQR